MQTIRKAFYFFGLITIAIWLFTMHTSFAYALNPITDNIYYSGIFVLYGIDFKQFIPYFWGLAFSIAITTIIANLHKSDKHFWKFAITVATLELLGVAFFNYPSHDNVWTVLGGIYYGVYAFFLTLFYFYVKPEDKEVLNNENSFKIHNNSKTIENNSGQFIKNSEEFTDKEIADLLKSGVRNRDITLQYGLNDFKINKIKRDFGLPIKQYKKNNVPSKDKAGE
jgi:hypothetical protein